MEAEAASKSLWSQVQKGAQPLDPIVPQLGARDPNDPMMYSKIMKTIREEDVFIAAKARKSETPKGD